MASAETTERLQARITADQEELFKEAAAIRGVTLTYFVVSSADEAAMRTLEPIHVIQLSRRDQRRFASAVIRPPQPNARLRAAARRHARPPRGSRTRTHQP